MAREADAQLFQIVLQGGGAAGGELLLSCATTESATVSWLSDGTSWSTAQMRNQVRGVLVSCGAGHH